jgi:hypothetical protein
MGLDRATLLSNELAAVRTALVFMAGQFPEEAAATADAMRELSYSIAVNADGHPSELHRAETYRGLAAELG